MDRKTLKSKIKNGEKIKVYKTIGYERYLILVYKKESIGYKSYYKKIPVLYIITAHFDGGFYTAGKFTGKNIKKMEGLIKEKEEKLIAIDNIPNWETLERRF